MKTVVYTQRVEVVESYNERRDCADQRIAKFIEACNYLPIPVPNGLENIRDWIKEIDPAGIILTGGNSLVSLGGNAPERDETDRMLIEIALEKNIPLYGFCRGMQSILDYFGSPLENVTGHVAIRHKLCEKTNLEVNSYHNQGCLAKKVKEPLHVLAQTEDGVAEWICHKTKTIEGTMWHPEREQIFMKEDIDRVKTLIDGGIE